MQPGDQENKDVLLLSGGIDSIALAAWVQPKYAITIDYGQQCAAAEIAAATQVASELDIIHHVIKVDCTAIGSGDLLGDKALRIAPASDWWPFRNQLLITFAAAYALRFDAARILIGTVANDSYHVDGSERFLTAIDSLIALQEGAIRVVAPAMSLSSLELIRISNVPHPILAWAHSCHKSNFACGVCRGCNKHRETRASLDHVAE